MYEICAVSNEEEKKRSIKTVRRLKAMKKRIIGTHTHILSYLKKALEKHICAYLKRKKNFIAFFLFHAY